MDWSKLDLVVYFADAKPSDELVCLPSDNVLKHVSVAGDGKSYRVITNSFGASVGFKVINK